MGTRTLLGLLTNGLSTGAEGYLFCPFVLGKEILVSCICDRKTKKQTQREKVSLGSRTRQESRVVEYLVTLINGVYAASISVRNSSLYKAFDTLCQKERRNFLLPKRSGLRH